MSDTDSLYERDPSRVNYLVLAECPTKRMIAVGDDFARAIVGSCPYYSGAAVQGRFCKPGVVVVAVEARYLDGR